MTVTLAAAEPAKEELRLALKENPKNSWALYNLGLMTYLEQDFKTAAKHWKALKELEPSDWQVREKLIQAYWGAGESESANSEIAQLRKARESGKHAELNKKGFFICDQFQVGKIRAFVLEYYELKGERPLAWKFILKSGEHSRQVKAVMPDSMGDSRVRLSREMCRESDSNFTISLKLFVFSMYPARTS